MGSDRHFIRSVYCENSDTIVDHLIVLQTEPDLGQMRLCAS